MSVVDHHDGAVAFGERSQFADRADIAIHGEDSIGDDQLAAGFVLHFTKQLFAVSDILVAKDLDGRPRETCAVDDGGVVELVGEDEILLAENGADGACVSRKAGLEDDAGFHVLERGDLLFKLHVDAHGSGDRAHGA